MTYILIPKIILALATGILAPILLAKIFKFSTRTTIFIWAAGFITSASILILNTGLWPSLLVVTWLCITAYAFIIGLKRFAIWMFDDTAAFLVNAGCMYLLVGGIWLYASTNVSGFLGFFEPWKTLTAIHFHIAAFLFPVSVGLISKSKGDNARSLWFRLSAIIYIISIALVAIGLSGSRYTELLGVSLFNLSGLSLLSFLLLTGGTIKKGRFILSIGLGFGIIGLLLSLLYSWRIGPLMTLDYMVFTHGIINGAILTPALVYCAVRNFPEIDLNRSIPFSRLKASFRVGPNYFESCKIASKQAPAGLVDNFRIFECPDLEMDRIDDAVLDFYENTAAYRLDVKVRRAVWFRYLWDGLVGPWFRRCEQFNLPAIDKKINGTLVRLDPASDGRNAPIGWIRTDESTGQAVYLAAYSTHTTDAITYMNIAFPLPRANITSILHVANGNHPGGIKLTTSKNAKVAGDQGVYLVNRLLKMRLPLNETINVWHDEKLRAKHEMWFFGLKYLTLDYMMVRD